MAPVLASFWLWAQAERPDVLISDTGTLVGTMTKEGRALSKERGAGFVARNWLENDGDQADQQRASQRWQGGRVLHVSGKRALARFEGCAADQILVASVAFDTTTPVNCPVFDPEALKQTGAIAIYWKDGQPQFTTARQRTGNRLWTNWPAAKPSKLDQYVRISPTSRP